MKCTAIRNVEVDQEGEVILAVAGANHLDLTLTLEVDGELPPTEIQVAITLGVVGTCLLMPNQATMELITLVVAGTLLQILPTAIQEIVTPVVGGTHLQVIVMGINILVEDGNGILNI